MKKCHYCQGHHWQTCQQLIIYPWRSTDVIYSMLLLFRTIEKLLLHSAFTAYDWGCTNVNCSRLWGLENFVSMGFDHLPVLWMQNRSSSFITFFKLEVPFSTEWSYREAEMAWTVNCLLAVGHKAFGQSASQVLRFSTFFRLRDRFICRMWCGSNKWPSS